MKARITGSTDIDKVNRKKNHVGIGLKLFSTIKIKELIISSIPVRIDCLQL